MSNIAAKVTLAARRNEVARFTIAVTGIDLTGVAMAMQVRQTVDNPYLLFALGTVATLAAEGLKLDSVTVTNGVPTSIIKGRINASTMTDATKVPYLGEIGTDSPLAYAMQWTLNGDAQTRLYGDFIVVASAFASDAAPTNRSASYGAPQSTSGGSNSGNLTFGDQVVTVTLDGSELLIPLVARSELAVGRAESAAQTVRSRLDDISETVTFGISTTPSAGLNASAANYVLRLPFPSNEPITHLQLFGGTAGGLCTIRYGTLVDNVFTAVGDPVVVTVDASKIKNFDISLPIRAGHFIVLSAAAGVLSYKVSTDDIGGFSSGGVVGAATFATGAVTRNNALQVAFGYTRVAIKPADVKAATASLTEIRRQRIGRAGDPVAAALKAGSSNYVYGTPAQFDGFIREIGFYSDVAATFKARTYDKADDIFTPSLTTDLVAVAGKPNIFKDLSIRIFAGQMPGLFAPVPGALGYTTGISDATLWYSGGATPGTFTDAAASPNQRLELYFVIERSDFINAAERIAAVERGIAPKPISIVAAGNSLTIGAVPPGGSAIVPWLTQLAAELGITGINKGVSGQTIQQMIDAAPMAIDPLAFDPNSRRILIVDGEPYNYLRKGMSPADYPTDAAAAKHVVDKLEEFCEGRREAGFSLILLVDMAAHNTDINTNNAQKEGCYDRTTTPPAVNAEVQRRKSDFADGVIVISTASQLSDYTNAIYYQVAADGGVHGTTAYHTVVKNRVRAGLAPWR